MKRRRLGLAVLPFLVFACGDDAPPPKTPLPPPPPVVAVVDAGPPAPPLPPFGRVTRKDFNRVAAELASPLFWTQDDDKDGIIAPSEVAVYWGLDSSVSLKDFVENGKFTPRFNETYEAIVKARITPLSETRQTEVQKELSQGRSTLVASDFSKLSDGEKKFAAAIFHAATTIETLYAKQEGVYELRKKVPDSDLVSKAMFFRNQEPRCRAPFSENRPDCGGLKQDDMPKGRITGMYPADLINEPGFCDGLAKNKDKSLIDPFTVVWKDQSGKLTSIPYTKQWPLEMRSVSDDLKQASAALGQTEPALRKYLDAAAQAFLDNKWWPADEAWAKMDTKNSKFYLRVGPDEVYHEPCSTKALFHVSFALVNQGATTWKAKLEPKKKEMEAAIAKLAGAPYTARNVTFKIPDFIDVVLNAGDARAPFGATVGQSLPNFGPVANEGRGRTVAMTNFYTDPDSIQTAREAAGSLFCKDTMAKWTDNPESLLMSTVLHEASHNLGPAHQYKANGKIDRESFGGPLASTLEELKAQTAALFYTDWLVGKNEIDREAADKGFVRDMFWAFGHISRGMYEDNHHPKNYSQLAAIQVGWLMNKNALVWRAEEQAPGANKDKGCFAVDFAKIPDAVTSLMTEVAQIKGTGNKERAETLIKDWVDVTGDRLAVLKVITERMTRAPKQTFVYSVKLD